jgi:hypothetical protein
MFHQLLAEILPSLTKGRPNNNNNTNNNNKAKCIPGGTLRVLAGKNSAKLRVQCHFSKHNHLRVTLCHFTN